MATVNEHIIARSDLDPLVDVRLQALIALAEERSYSSCYDENTKNAMIALRALHAYTLGPDGMNSAGSGITGTIKSETEGDLSRTYDTGSSIDFGNSESFLRLTQYGLEILALQKENIFKPRTKIGVGC